MVSKPLSDILTEIDRHGSIGFSRFQTVALYGAGGFYEQGGPGRRRDFITSPEVGPLFGRLVARWIDRVWDDLGQPSPFVVVEAAAGNGILAKAVLRSEPRCRSALRYIMVEQSGPKRAEQATHHSLTPPQLGFAMAGEDADGEDLPSAAQGPLVFSLTEVPRGPLVGVVFANELLDNIVVDIVECTSDGWNEIRVGRQDDQLIEVAVPASSAHSDRANRLVPDAVVGQRIPIQNASYEWVRHALEQVERGQVLIIDYARETSAMAAGDMGDWLRTYNGQERGTQPLLSPGSRDITCDVATDQLPAGFVQQDQADWLGDLGIEELVAEGKAMWEAAASAPGLAAMEARSRISEAEALTDPDGLGAFVAFTWTR
jgi:SAM-dependent MidA family methyltransferase